MTAQKTLMHTDQRVLAQPVELGKIRSRAELLTYFGTGSSRSRVELLTSGYDETHLRNYEFLTKPRPIYTYCMSHGLRPTQLADEHKCYRLLVRDNTPAPDDTKCVTDIRTYHRDISIASSSVSLEASPNIYDTLFCDTGPEGDDPCDLHGGHIAGRKDRRIVKKKPDYIGCDFSKGFGPGTEKVSQDAREAFQLQRRLRRLNGCSSDSVCRSYNKLQSCDDVEDFEPLDECGPSACDNALPSAAQRLFDSYDHSHLSDSDLVDKLVDDGDRERVKRVLAPPTLGVMCDIDYVLGATRSLAPLCGLLYGLYRARNRTDALVAALSYLERMAVEDNYGTVKVGITWLSSFVSRYKDDVCKRISGAYDYLVTQMESFRSRGVPHAHLQSEDTRSIMDFLDSVTTGIQNHTKAQSFVWLVAFVFTSIGAARTGVFPDFNTFSRKSNDFVRQVFLLGSTGITVSLFVHAVRNCTEFVQDLLTQGIGTLWHNEVAIVTELRDRGRRLLEESLLVNITLEFGRIVKFGVDLDAYLNDVATHAPKLSARTMGSNILGVGFSSETNTAMIWAGVRKLHGELLLAQQRYKVMMATISYRRQPFTIAAVGGSSLGKSLWVQATAAMINLNLGVDHDPRLIYTVNPGSDYFDGYKSYMTVTVLDDVATLRSDFQPNGDVHVKNIIGMVNNTAMLTPQADLPDKKTCPFLSRAVLLTSNTRNFDAHVYANNPAAILRRIQYVVTLTVAPDFVNSDNGLDTTKAMRWSTANSGQDARFPPFWQFTVEVITAKNNGHDSSIHFIEAHRQKVLDKCNTETYLAWFKEAWDAHERNQDSAVAQVAELSSLRLCDQCRLPHPYHHPRCALRPVNPVLNSDDYFAWASNGLDDASVSATINDTRVRYGCYVGFFIICGVMCLYLAKRCVLFVARAILSVRNRLEIAEYMLYEGRDRMILTMATMEDAANNVSHTSHVWRSIGVPIAGAAAVAGIQVSWLCTLPSVLYGILVAFPTARVRSLFTFQRVMVATATIIAGGMVLKSYTRKPRRVDEDGRGSESFQSDTTTCDFSANDQAAKWGDGKCHPFAGSSRVIAMSAASKCASGLSYAGALAAIEKSVFSVCVSSLDGVSGRTCTSIGTGFVYSKDPPVIIVNKHTIDGHFEKGTFRLKLMFSPNNTNAAINDFESDRPQNCVHVSVVDKSHVIFDLDSDVAMIYVPGLNRRGIAQYMVHLGHTHGGMRPQLITRDKYGHLVTRTLSGFRDGGPLNISEQTKICLKSVKLKKSYAYDMPSEPTQNGDSGSLLIVSSGDPSVGENGGVGVMGMHVMASLTSIHCAPLYKEVCDKLLHHLRSTLSQNILDNVGSTLDCALNCLTEFVPVGVSDNVFDLDKGSRGGSLVDTHHKAAINWITVGGDTSVQVFGSILGDSRHNQGLRTSYRPTIWSSDLYILDPVLGDTSCRYMPTIVPRDQLWKVHHNTLHDLLRSGAGYSDIPCDIADNAVTGLVEDIILGVSMSNRDGTWKSFGVLSYAEAINGRDGVLEGINWATGGGFGYSGAKRRFRREQYIPALEGVKTQPHYILEDAVMDSIRAADELLRKGVDPGFVYTAHLKDEIRSCAKVRDHKIRMICGASIPAIVLMRKYLAPVLIFMQQNPLPTECAVGINTESNQWDDLANYLREYGGVDRFIAGDYVNFDKNQTLQISIMASKVMYALVLHAHSLNSSIYNAGDIMAIKTLLFGLCYPKYDHFGVLLGVIGSNPSGNSLTAQRNSIANSLYTRCAFIWLAKECVGICPRVARKLFARVVRQINYGDDMLQAVRDNYHWYNHDTITYALKQWGVPFTHADKSTVVGVPYDHFDKITFVKRSFVYNSEIGAYMAPLDKASVVKSLHFVDDSKCATNHEAHVLLVRAAAENMLAHGRETYDKFCELSRELVVTSGLYGENLEIATDFPSWDSFIDRWRTNSTNRKFGVCPKYDVPPVYNVTCITGPLGELI